MDRLKRATERLPIKEYVRILELAAGAGSRSLNIAWMKHPLARLAAKMEKYPYDATFKRARHLWLECHRLGLLPPREVEEQFLKQLRSDDEIWSKPEPKDSPMA